MSLSHRVVFALLVFLSGVSGKAVAEVDPVMAGHVELLNEVTERRRVNTFFPNEQTVFNGAQKGFVNTGSGNLTFLRRDLVTVGRLPVVFARVFDSAGTEGSDFSPGWRISIAETIRTNADGSLDYVDDSNSKTRFTNSGGAYITTPAQPSDVKSLVATANGFTVSLRNQWTKKFEHLGDLARLTEVIDNNGNTLTLNYDTEHRLTLIVGQNGRSVIIARNVNGQVSQITDDQGRKVSYSYNNKGELEQISDLGGKFWHYQYANDQLHQVIDPRGNQAALISYHQSGKVKHTKIRQVKHTYEFQGNSTLVSDEAGNTSVYVQNSLGITANITNAQGFVSEIELNSKNEVATLHHNGQARGIFTYDTAGNPERMVRYDAEGSVELTYIFDWKDRVLAISGTDGTNRTLSYDPKGNLVSKTENGVTTQFQYNNFGDLMTRTENGEITLYEYNDDGLQSQLSKNNETSHFAYSDIGRLTSITFPDGNQHEYGYDSLGFRLATQRNDGSFDNFNYDSTGNITNFSGVSSQGNAFSEEYTLNQDNQLTKIEYPSQGQVNINYDSNGNPVTLGLASQALGTQTLSCQYDETGRLTAVLNSVFGESSYQYAETEADIRKQLDERTSGNLADYRRASNTLGQLSQMHYSRSHGTPWITLAWNPELSIMDIPSEMGMVSSSAVREAADQRRRLYNVLATDPQLQRSFDKASNSYFLPPEYASANCVFGIVGPVSLSAPSTAYVGTTIQVTASVLWVSPNCGAPYYYFTANGQYIGDGIAGFSFDILVDILTTGTLEIVVQVICSLVDSYTKFATKFVTKLSACTNATLISGAAITRLFSYASQQPFEAGALMYCVNGGFSFQNESTNSYTTLPFLDRCKMHWNGFIPTSGLLAALHTHPYFTAASQLGDCGTFEGQQTSQAVIITNQLNEVFSEGDNAFNALLQKPHWLRTPTLQIKTFTPGQ